MFSISYVLQRYVFTRLGISLVAAVALAVWVVSNIEGRNAGAAASEAELVLMSWVMLSLFGWAISVVIGAIIDGKRGALWGLLGPVGWIIAAIGRIEARSNHKRESHDRIESADQAASYDSKKWLILKEVDPEIKAASDRVCAIDPKLDAVLADKYLRLSQKEYLEPLVAKLISDAANEKDFREQPRIGFDPGIYETSGPFKFRILPDRSISVFSDPSGTMATYERFDSIDIFFDANLSRGARREAVTKLD